jgi:hypothetical protein
MIYDMPLTQINNMLQVNSAFHHFSVVSQWFGNGWTAMLWANKWYPGWSAFNNRWYNNCWWVYMKRGNEYKTVNIGPNYTWHYDQAGYIR